MGRFNDDKTMAWSTYKIFLVHIEEHFKGVSCPWNRNYANAQKCVPGSGADCRETWGHAGLAFWHVSCAFD